MQDRTTRAQGECPVGSTVTEGTRPYRPPAAERALLASQRATAEALAAVVNDLADEAVSAASVECCIPEPASAVSECETGAAILRDAAESWEVCLRAQGDAYVVQVRSWDGPPVWEARVSREPIAYGHGAVVAALVGLLPQVAAPQAGESARRGRGVV